MRKLEPLDEEVGLDKRASTYSQLRHVFAHNIRLARLVAGRSQEDISARAALHRTYLGGVERGERNLTLDNVERISEALGYSASELLSEDFLPRRGSQGTSQATLETITSLRSTDSSL